MTVDNRDGGDGGTSNAPGPGGTRSRTPLAVAAWLWVGLPLAYGLYELAQKVTQLFTG